MLNGSRNVLRRRKVARLYNPPADVPVWSAEHEAVLGEDRREVLYALAALPTRRREVLVLRFYLHLPDAEIAETLGISPATVRSTASRALNDLARRLERPDERPREPAQRRTRRRRPDHSRPRRRSGPPGRAPDTCRMARSECRCAAATRESSRICPAAG